jgi:AMMECR1 domain-containing protein
MGWDRRQFLEGLCRKAGLPAQAWQSPQTILLGFRAQVF